MKRIAATCTNLSIIIMMLLPGSCVDSKRSIQEMVDIDFESSDDLQYFKPETQAEGKQVTVKDGALDIDAVKGATIWFREKLSAPVMIEYTAVVIDEGGPNDRVSDLNCFFMAIDPRCPADIFSCGDSVRTGQFGTYHALRTYYVGYGGNDNSTTRFRRYPGYTGERPLLPEHDLGPPEVLQANQPMNIKITVKGNFVSYTLDDRVIFEVEDELPYHDGWFAFRTVRNHMKILDFKVSKLPCE